MEFIKGSNRHQSYFSTLEDQVSADNPVRLMDAFIEKLDLARLGFTCPGSSGIRPARPACRPVCS